MLVHVAAVGKSFSAAREGANEWPLAGVDANVRYQIALVAENLLAKRASERLVPVVEPSMDVCVCVCARARLNATRAARRWWI